jgi:hypothetical protein
MMTDIEKQRTNRLLVMKAIYDAAGGGEGNAVSGPELLKTLDLPDRELADACKYLEGEQLIRGSRTLWSRSTPYTIHITHQGIKELEESLQAPGIPTAHFPPASITIHGNVIASPIQNASPNAIQVAATDIDFGSLRDFVSQLEKAAPQLGLPVEESRVLTADITTLKAQVDSPRPKRQIVRESLHSVRTIVEGAGGSLAATGILDALAHMHF